MPDRKFSREDIINAAFAVTRKQGWEKCTARTIARELGSSTMPIYSGVSCMQKLEDEIARRAGELLLEYQAEERSGYRFLDMGIGYVLFAQNEKNLFRMLYSRESGRDVSSDRIGRHRGYVFDAIRALLAEEDILSGFSRKEKEDILYKMWIFSHGLAVLSNNAVIGEMTEEEITRILQETGNNVIAGAGSKKMQQLNREGAPAARQRPKRRQKNEQT
jgi:AcrR family transcriptional regulator